MNLYDSKLRARVIEVDGQQAVLGIYVDGFWHRITARTEVVLTPGSWIVGRLTISDQQQVTLKLEPLDPGAEAAQAVDAYAPRSGLDLEV